MTPQAPPTDSKEVNGLDIVSRLLFKKKNFLSTQQESFEVDEEGYRIRPKDADKIAKFSDDESSHDDSSDFESDSDDGKV